MLRLAPHRLLPVEPEPPQVLEDRRLVFRPAAGRVDVLDAEQEPAARLPGHAGVEHRRIGMTEMQVAVGARRKSEDGCHAGMEGRRHADRDHIYIRPTGKIPLTIPRHSP